MKNENQIPEQTQEEKNISLEMFKAAVLRGDPGTEHLHPDQSIAGRYGRRLERMVMDLSKEDPISFEDLQLRKTMNAIYSIMANGNISRLGNLLDKNFSQLTKSI